MKKTVKLFIGVVVPFLFTQSYAGQIGAIPQLEPVAARLGTIVDKLPAGAVSSIIVRNAETGAILYEQHSKQNVMPASVQKVSTAIAAYEVLGPDFRFVTRLLSRHPISHSGKAEGGMQLLFGGDPSLTREQLRTMLGSLAKQGVKQISGTIWLDGSVYEGYPNAEGVVWNDLKICFAAPSTAMILDRNCFYALLKPAEQVGRKAVIEYARPDWPFRLENDVVTSAAGDKQCQAKSWESIRANYRLTGCVAKDSAPLKMAFAVKQSELATKAFVESVLRQEGIIHNGKVIIGKPDQVFKQTLADHYSEPLSKLLTVMLVTSDNLYADSILKTLGLHNQQKKGSYEAGVKALIDALQSMGADLGNSHLEDGSGLSRYNLVSASELSSVLLAGWQAWGRAVPWLEDRQKDYWLKTGTMKDTRAIAGYVFPKDEAPRVFAFILNGLVPENGSSEEEVEAFWFNIKAQQQTFIHKLLNK